MDYKEKKLSFLKLRKTAVPAYDLVLLEKLSRSPEVARYAMHPEKSADDILFALLEVATPDEIEENRDRLARSAQEEDSPMDDDNKPADGKSEEDNSDDNKPADDKLKEAEERADKAEERAEEAENRADEAEERAEEFEERAEEAESQLEEEKKKENAKA